MKIKYFYISFLLATCFVSLQKNPFRYTDAREIPVSGEERVRKNIEEGRGISFLVEKKKEEFLILHHRTNFGEHL